MNKVILINGFDKRFDPVTGTVRATFSIVSELLPSELWFEVKETYAEFISDQWDAALIALLAPAMALGHSIKIEGQVSAQLLSQVSSDVMTILGIITNYPATEISCQSLHNVSEWQSTGNNVTGFSGGVDSYSILKGYYYEKNETDRSRITHLIFNNIGANGSIEETELYSTRLDNSIQAAAEIGLPLISINSNMDAFYRPIADLHFSKTHTIRNAAVAHLLAKGIDNYYYASAYSYDQIGVKPSEYIAYSDPILLPKLSTRQLNIIATDTALTRVDKLVKISHLKVARAHLNVCVSHHSADNCSACQKCVRTMLALDVIGTLNLFSDSFNISDYLYNKEKYLVQCLTSDKIFDQDIKRTIVALKYKIPCRVLLIAKIKQAITLISTFPYSMGKKLRHLKRSIS